MIAYLDSSIILRILQGERGALAERDTITVGVASRLVEVECLRTIDRRRLLGNLTRAEASKRIDALYRQLEQFEIVEPSAAILRRAAQPLTTPLGTLDAIHLATAQAWRDDRDLDLTVATHDRALAAAAKAFGFAVIGID